MPSFSRSPAQQCAQRQQVASIHARVMEQVLTVEACIDQQVEALPDFNIHSSMHARGPSSPAKADDSRTLLSFTHGLQCS